MTWPQGIRAAVLGLGVAGEACSRALARNGANVTVYDEGDSDALRARIERTGGAQVVLGSGAPDLSDHDLAVLSPGIAPSSPLWKAAHTASETFGEIELAYRLGVRAEAAVTGTNGKTTVTEMIAGCLSAAGADAAVAGNIGAPLVEATAGRIVAEVSSFHLETVDRFRVPVGVLLNVAHDHIDWHGTFERYREAKARMATVTTQRLIVNVDCVPLVQGSDAAITAFTAGEPGPDGAGVRAGRIVTPQGEVMPVGSLRSDHRAFVEDAVAAAAAACAMGVEPAVAGEALAAYRPGAHRMADLGRVHGVRFIDDSKATDPHAALAAIEAFPGSVLIAGGRNRSRDLASLGAAAFSLTAVVALGEAAGEVCEVFASEGLPCEQVSSMDEAVRRAFEAARPDGTVLLSPACASLDMFDSYAARGDAFVAAVRALEGS